MTFWSYLVLVHVSGLVVWTLPLKVRKHTVAHTYTVWQQHTHTQCQYHSGNTNPFNTHFICAPVAGDGSNMITQGQCQIRLAPTGAKQIWYYPRTIMFNTSPPTGTCSLVTSPGKCGRGVIWVKQGGGGGYKIRLQIIATYTESDRYRSLKPQLVHWW